MDTFERPVFPCALIAGDVVLLHLLHELGYLADKRVTVVFIDTFHLFPETHTFLHQLEVSQCWGLLLTLACSQWSTPLSAAAAFKGGGR